jgi:CHAT domain-containing protein
MQKKLQQPPSQPADTGTAPAPSTERVTQPSGGDRAAQPAAIALTLRFSREGDGARIAWESDAVGHLVSTFHPPYDLPTLQLIVKALDAAQLGVDFAAERLTQADQDQLTQLGLWTGSQPVADIHKRVGQKLYEQLVADSAGATALSNVRNAATHQGVPVSYLLRFPPDAAELAMLPWELLWDQDNALLLSRGEPASCVRYLDLHQALPPPLPNRQKLRILAVAPNAGIEPDIREKERAARTAVWSALEAAGAVQTEELNPATRSALVDRIQNGEPVDILHFYGHGRYKDGMGALLFDTDDDDMTWVSAKQLATLLGKVRLVVLNACRSSMVGEQGLLNGVAPALIAAGVPAVVAMQLTVRADSARRFATVEYRSLARGETLQQAINLARQALFFEEDEGGSWYVPTLMIRARDTGPLYLINPTEGK